MRDAGGRARGGSAHDARVLRDARRAARVRHRLRVHRRHHGAGEIPGAYQAVPLPKSEWLFFLIIVPQSV